MKPTLTEALGSTTSIAETSQRAGKDLDARPDSATANQIVITVRGCGLEDEEVFEVPDLKAGRAAMRKLMASAIRQFGKSDEA